MVHKIYSSQICFCYYLQSSALNISNLFCQQPTVLYYLGKLPFEQMKRGARVDQRELKDSHMKEEEEELCIGQEETETGNLQDDWGKCKRSQTAVDKTENELLHRWQHSV